MSAVVVVMSRSRIFVPFFLFVLSALVGCDGDPNPSFGDTATGDDTTAVDDVTDGDSATAEDTSPPDTSRPDTSPASDTDGGETTDGTTADTASDAGDAAPDSRTDDTTGDIEGDADTTSAACDYRTVDDIVVMEAESLNLTDDWETRSDESGYTGSGYIEWTGSTNYNDPSMGRIDVTFRIDTPGRYRLSWHTRIGKGSDSTEHNDTWVKFPDADDYYGLKGSDGAEIRRYPKPTCNDSTFMDMIRSKSEVDEATCAEGSSKNDWMKVYSTGANDWKWSAFTSDSDASKIMVELDSAGVYTLSLAARSAHNLLDRIVLYHEDADRSTATDLDRQTSPCP